MPIAVTCLLLGSLVACGILGSDEADTTVLKQLQADPLAARTQTHGRLVNAQDYAHRSSDPMTGKPTRSSVTRAFEPVEPTSLEQLNQELVDLARGSGWTVAQPPGEGSRGSKDLSFGKAQVVITVNRYVSPATVVVALTPVDPNL